MLSAFCFAAVLVALCFGHIRVAVVLGLMFAGAALADVPVQSTDEVELALRLIGMAMESKNPVLLVPVLVLVLVAAARKFAPWPVLKTDRGGAVLNLVLSLAISVGGSLLLGKPLSVALLVSAASSVISAGGYTLAKKMIAPSDADAPVASPIDLANRRGPQP